MTTQLLTILYVADLSRAAAFYDVLFEWAAFFSPRLISAYATGLDRPTSVTVTRLLPHASSIFVVAVVH